MPVAAPGTMKVLGSSFWVGVAAITAGMLCAIGLAVSQDAVVIRSVVAVGLLWLGARLVANAWERREAGLAHRELWLGRGRYAPHRIVDEASCDVVLGRSVIDLRGLEPPEREATLRIYTVLGGTEIQVDPAIPYDVVVDSMFGSVAAPANHASRPGSGVLLHLVLVSICGRCRVVESARRAPDSIAAS